MGLNQAAKSKDTFRYEAILFDVGDTLLIRKPTPFQVLAERCQKVGIALELSIAQAAWEQAEIWAGEQSLREMAGVPRMPDSEFFKQLDYVALRTVFREKADNEIWEMVSIIQPIQVEKKTWEIIKGVHEILGKLKDRSYKLGIVSNFDESLPQILEKFNLINYFDIVIASSLVGVEKPNPKILQIACSSLKVNPRRSLYVGDHPLDVFCAKKAGMDVAWICEKSDMFPQQIHYKPDYRLSSVIHIKELILVD